MSHLYFITILYSIVFRKYYFPNICMIQAFSTVTTYLYSIILNLRRFVGASLRCCDFAAVRISPVRRGFTVLCILYAFSSCVVVNTIHMWID